MTPIQLHAAPDADLDALAARLGSSATADRLRWRLHPPCGPGLVALGPEGSAVAVAPDRATRDGRSIGVLRFVAAAGSPLRRAALLAALHEAAAENGASPPLIAVATAPPSAVLRPAERLPAWVTGPDPLIGTQRRVDTPDATHDALATSLLDDRWRLRRDAAVWRWRLAEPDRELAFFDVPGPDGLRGVLLLRERRIRGVRTLEILDLQALDRSAHYDLLKTARRHSWDRGGLPVVLRGEAMTRRYAFTAGYLRADHATAPRRLWAVGHPPGPWALWGMDG